MFFPLMALLSGCVDNPTWIEGDWSSVEGARLSVHPPVCSAMGQQMSCEVIPIERDRAELRVERGGRWTSFTVERADPQILLHDGSVVVYYERTD
jgi:hypothetical protein